MPLAPMVRAVVVNYNGQAFIRRCVDALLATDWPAAQLEVVVVDNGSSDGSIDVLGDIGGDIRLIRSATNLGFAGGMNLGIGDLSGVDFVALVNSDAFVEPGWLHPLIAELEASPALGAVCPKLLFEPSFFEVALETEGWTPGTGDPRELGVVVGGIRSSPFGFRSMRFGDGFFGEEHGGVAERFRWSGPSASLYAPIARDTDRVELLLVAPEPKQVKLVCGSESRAVEAAPEPRWIPVPVAGEVFDIVNNAGSLLVEGGHGADRGFGEPDRGQFGSVEEVFAWCGAAAVIRSSYVADVGRFDPTYFLYYEDTDLSWRGRSRGWSYRYVPDSRVRHMHTASTVEGSALFNHFVQRNRLLTLVKNAPKPFAARQVVEFGAGLARLAFGELIEPRFRGQRAHAEHTPGRLRAAAGFAERLPRAAMQRRTIDRRRTVPAADIMSRWLVVD